MPSSRPPRPVCHLCAFPDDVQSEPEGPGLWRHTCTADAADHPYSWVATDSADVMRLPDGTFAEIGLYDAIVSVLDRDRWLEHGVVEHLLAETHPALYADMVRRWGHHALVHGSPNSASQMLAMAAGNLDRVGDVVRRWGPATGRWRYNGGVFAYALPPSPASDDVVTWESYAIDRGFDPEGWPALGV
jgi:hypothetical protein